MKLVSAGLDAGSGVVQSLVLFRGLRQLDLSGNRLAEVPEALLQLHGLTSLNLSRNCLTWYAHTQKPDSRPGLVCESCALAGLLGTSPHCAGLAPCRAILNVQPLPGLRRSSNPLQLCFTQNHPEMPGSWLILRWGSLPAGLGGLSRLEDLDLGRNELSGVPDALGDLTQLRTLNLMANKLTSLPESLGRLTSVFRLGLKSNALKYAVC